MAMSKRIVVTAGVVMALAVGAMPAAAQGLVTPFIGSVFGGDVPASRATYGVSFVSNHGPLGAEHSSGLFFEVTGGAVDSPDLKLGIGYRLATWR
jgi:hypothetical protein